MSSKYHGYDDRRTRIQFAPGDLPGVLRFMQRLWAAVHGIEHRSAGDLATIPHVHPSTLTGVIQRLAGRRLLVPADDLRDRRRAVLHPTAGGARANVARRGRAQQERS